MYAPVWVCVYTNTILCACMVYNNSNNNNNNNMLHMYEDVCE